MESHLFMQSRHVSAQMFIFQNFGKPSKNVVRLVMMEASCNSYNRKVSLKKTNKHRKVTLTRAESLGGQKTTFSVHQPSLDCVGSLSL